MFLLFKYHKGPNTYHTLISGAGISGNIFTFIITHINPAILQITDRVLLYSIMNLGSKVMLFLLCMIVALFFRNTKYEHPVEYSVLLFTTPVITVTIFSFTPLHFLSESNNLLFYEILFVCLTLLNIVNYVLIQKTFATTIIKYTNMNIQRQLDFQKKKYEQLGESYRQTRRIIHDVKKHYFYIQEQIKNNTMMNYWITLPPLSRTWRITMPNTIQATLSLILS